MQPARRPTSPFLFALATLLPLATAQQGPPQPAPELQKLQPLIGSWQGHGDMHVGGKTASWDAVGTYRWSLGNFWVQEDFAITFAGSPQPLVLRAYLGWDAERRCYRSLNANSAGELALDDVDLGPDGTLMQMAVRRADGMTFGHRAVFKVTGDTMVHSVDMLLANGPSTTLVEGTFHRVDKEPKIEWPKASFDGTPAAEPMPKLALWAGAFDVKGTMTMAPGAPAIAIKGTDTYEPIFGGKILYAHTDGEAEGMPGKYEAVTFFGYDPAKGCLVSASVSNQGEVGAMDMRLLPDGKSLVGAVATTMMGQPLAQRCVIALGDKGAPDHLAVHSCQGAAAPYESFRASYTKK